MLDNWLVPSAHLRERGADTFEVWQLGHAVSAYRDPGDLPDLTSGAVALIGLAAREADRVRHHLYRMARPGPELDLVDLGNARRPDGVFNATVMRELLLAGVTPLFIGREADGCLAQYLGYHQAEFLTNLVVVDDRLRFQARDVATERGYLDRIFDLTPVRLFHLAAIGYQTHYNDPAALEYLHQHHFEFVRLGACKYDIDECEPIVRDADAVCLQLSALKLADAPAQEPPGASGFSSEEACQLARFTGMADKVTSFGVYGYLGERDASGHTAETVAQLAWYFVEGYANRKHDFPVTTDGLTEYVVQLDGRAPQITFWKSERSGRWWMEMPYELDGGPRHKYIPCTYGDYLRACERELPDRLVDAYKRFV